MNHFVYFLPGKRAAGLDTLLAAGLGHVFSDGGFSSRVTERGPDGSGLLVSRSETACRYDGQSQEWEKSPTGNFWIGCEKASRPTPEDLLRDDAAQGLWSVKLCDGNSWNVPTARLYPEGTALPQVRKYAEGGGIVRDVKPEYQELYLAADEVWQSLNIGVEMTEIRAQEICEMALRANYRVSHAEINLLGLLDDVNVAVLLQVLVSFPHWKTENEG